MAAWTYSATSEANLMKIKYGKLKEKQFNQDNKVLSQLKIIKDFVGSEIKAPVELSIGGGISAGTLGTASVNKFASVSLTAKKLYGTIKIDSETMQAAKTDEGAFVRMTVKPVKTLMKSFNRNLERMIVRGDVTGTGALITGNASNSNVTVSGSTYTVSFDAASTYYESDASPFEEGDYLNVNSETTDLLIDSVTTTATSVVLTLTGTSSRLATLAAGPNPFGASDKLYMENSKDKELFGLDGILNASSSTLYGITVGRRWQAFQKAAGSVDISTDLINEVVIGMINKCGEKPDAIVCGLKQYVKILNMLEDKKSYDVRARYDADISFETIFVNSPMGKIPVILNRFMKETQIFFLNNEHIELHLRPEGFGWLDQDQKGTIFARDNSNRDDSYIADYGGYGQLLVNPNFQGILTGLAV